MNSKIFTPTEQKEFERRLKGEKKDYRIWYRVKPKLIELIELFKLKRKIEKLLKIKNGKTNI
ncbi:hypothetical protein LCGC14_2127200 [marine sediment metagenome]|uniref:Uncharacterized protein n=1 Tax=marine sediment metagenome TaxID=412755 RepID=A0A0F9EPM4_9ZZZZ